MNSYNRRRFYLNPTDQICLRLFRNRHRRRHRRHRRRCRVQRDQDNAWATPLQRLSASGTRKLSTTESERQEEREMVERKGVKLKKD